MNCKCRETKRVFLPDCLGRDSGGIAGNADYRSRLTNAAAAIRFFTIFWWRSRAALARLFAYPPLSRRRSDRAQQLSRPSASRSSAVVDGSLRCRRFPAAAQLNRCHSPWNAPSIDPKGSAAYGRAITTEPVAQPVEHLTFNQGVAGSSPAGLTKEIISPSSGLCKTIARLPKEDRMKRTAKRILANKRKAKLRAKRSRQRARAS